MTISKTTKAEVPSWPSISFSKAFSAINENAGQIDDPCGTAMPDPRVPPPRPVNSGITKRQRAHQNRPQSCGQPRPSSRSGKADLNDKPTESSVPDVLTSGPSLSRRRTRRHNAHARDSWASGRGIRARSLKRSLSYQANIDYDEFIACQKWLVRDIHSRASFFHFYV